MFHPFKKNQENQKDEKEREKREKDKKEERRCCEICFFFSKELFLKS